jgi:hypothetical protein
LWHGHAADHPQQQQQQLPGTGTAGPEVCQPPVQQLSVNSQCWLMGLFNISSTAATTRQTNQQHKQINNTNKPSNQQN